VRLSSHVPDERWNEFGPGAVGVGWDLAFLGLHHHLADVPFDDQTWTNSEPGRTFVSGSSRGWRDASINAGTPPDAATAAAERTTAAYSGEAGATS
jgi:hypothetical protein